MFCVYCGREMLENHKFCVSCGKIRADLAFGRPAVPARKTESVDVAPAARASLGGKPDGKLESDPQGPSKQVDDLAVSMPTPEEAEPEMERAESSSPVESDGGPVSEQVTARARAEEALLALEMDEGRILSDNGVILTVHEDLRGVDVFIENEDRYIGSYTVSVRVAPIGSSVRTVDEKNFHLDFKKLVPAFFGFRVLDSATYLIHHLYETGVVSIESVVIGGCSGASLEEESLEACVSSWFTKGAYVIRVAFDGIDQIPQGVRFDRGIWQPLISMGLRGVDPLVSKDGSKVVVSGSDTQGHRYCYSVEADEWTKRAHLRPSSIWASGKEKGEQWSETTPCPYLLLTAAEVAKFFVETDWADPVKSFAGLFKSDWVHLPRCYRIESNVVSAKAVRHVSKTWKDYQFDIRLEIDPELQATLEEAKAAKEAAIALDRMAREAEASRSLREAEDEKNWAAWESIRHERESALASASQVAIEQPVSKEKPYDVIELAEKDTVTLDRLHRHGVSSCDDCNLPAEKVFFSVPVFDFRGKRIRVRVTGYCCPECGRYYLPVSSYEELGMRGFARVGINRGRDGGKSVAFGEIDLEQESLLHSHGYNVGQRENLTEREREQILKRVIDERVMTKRDCMFLIRSFIARAEGRTNADMSTAISRWQHDLGFLSELR